MEAVSGIIYSAYCPVVLDCIVVISHRYRDYIEEFPRWTSKYGYLPFIGQIVPEFDQGTNII